MSRRPAAALLVCVALAMALGAGCTFGGSCTVPGASFCLDYTSTGFAASDIRAACDRAGSTLDAGPGTFDPGGCSTANLLGTCTRHPGTAQETVEYDYDGGVRSAADFQALCSGGVWRVP